MQVGTRVRVKATAGLRGGESGTIVALKRSAPVGLTWNEVKRLPMNSAEIRFDDGCTPWSLFSLNVLEAI